MYKILIQKVEKNPHYEKEMDQIREREKYGNYNHTRPQEFIEIRALETLIDETEFQRIKKSALEVM